MAGGRHARRGLWGLDIPSLLVAPIGLLVVLWAQSANGLTADALLNWPAALVVCGGTLGAVLISYSPTDLLDSARAAWGAMRVLDDDVDALAATMVSLSVRVHRYGLISIEPDVERLGDPFLRDALALALDTSDGDTVEAFLSAERLALEAAEEGPARVFEAAAGYAPTLGILGAVLGLIRVMQDLGTSDGLGAGIAAAFVATAYGVGAANLLLLPMAGRLRERAARTARRRELISQGVRAIQKRANPRLVAQGLRALSPDVPRIEDLLSSRTPASGLHGASARASEAA